MITIDEGAALGDLAAILGRSCGVLGYVLGPSSEVSWPSLGGLDGFFAESGTLWRALGAIVAQS